MDTLQLPIEHFELSLTQEFILLTLFNFHGSVHHKNIVIYIQQDATLHSLFYLETAVHISAGTTTHHQERKQLYLHRLVFVTPLLLPAASRRQQN